MKIIAISIFLLFTLLILPVSAYYTSEIIPPSSGFLPEYNATFPGERNAGQWYEFSINNVSGDRDVKYHFTVYDAEIKDSYEYRSDAWGQWWEETPARGNKFLFIWICGYSEGTSWDGYEAERFYLWDNGKQINQEPIIQSDIGKVNRGTTTDNRVPPRTIRFIENRSSYLEFTYSQDAYGYQDGLVMNRMEPGISNAWNGYIIYQIPKTSELKDMQILGWFGYHGTAIWNLKPVAYIQNSPEALAIKERQKITKEIALGTRQKDNGIVKRPAV
jgi:hypothetical protein